MIRRLLRKILGRGMAPAAAPKAAAPSVAPSGLHPSMHADLLHDPAFLAAWERCREATLTTPERLHALHAAIRHVMDRRIPGDIVECGVWRGGSMMLCAAALAERGDTARELYLYDTYSGMSEPTGRDRDFAGTPATALLAGGQAELFKCEAPLDLVRRNLLSTPYPRDRIRFVQGKVEDTIPGVIPEQIALLRLDTDWYESTRHELVHLYPRLVDGGVLIIDDYGHWQGPREAVDEYFASLPHPPLLHRIDYSGRIAVKPPSPARS